MNNYICEYINGDDVIRTMCVRACSKIQARSMVRAITRRFGYTVLLKNINVLYIDNSKTPINV